MAKEEKQLTKWQAVRIGALVWLVPIVLIFSLPLSITYVGNGIASNIIDFFALFMFPIILLLPAMPCAVAGALVGRFWRKSRRAMWIGAVIGTILGFGVSVLILNLLNSRFGWDPFAGL